MGHVQLGPTNSRYGQDSYEAQPDATPATSREGDNYLLTPPHCGIQQGRLQVPYHQYLGASPPNPEFPPLPHLDVPQIHPSD